MVPLTAEPVTDRGTWFRVETGSPGSALRRAAERLGEQLGLPDSRIADLAIVAAELTSNLIKHAEDGLLLLRPVRRELDAGVELVAIDSGPGMIDLVDSARDGHSTTGTLGIGLGAIVRQASWFDAYSQPGRGTVIAVQVFADAETARPWVGGVIRPLTGETISGDGYAWRSIGERRQVLVTDGLGHGPLAAAATDAALAAFRAAPAAAPPRWSATCTGRCRTPEARRSPWPSRTRRPGCCGTPGSATSAAWWPPGMAGGEGWSRCPVSPGTNARRSGSTTTRSTPTAC